MTTPGAGFPVLGPGGVQKWWVVPEGGLGQLINSLTLAGTTKNLYTVKEAVNRPSGAVGNPFSTETEAQTQANALNARGRAAAVNASPGAHIIPTGINAVGDLAHKLTESQTWIRVGEFIAGAMLLYVGLKAFFPTTVNNVTGVAKGTVKAAKMGLI